jgi:hypothetical protein
MPRRCLSSGSPKARPGGGARRQEARAGRGDFKRFALSLFENSRLDAPTASEILHVEIKDRNAVGEKIGVWPIFSLSDDEVLRAFHAGVGP